MQIKNGIISAVAAVSLLTGIAIGRIMPEPAEAAPMAETIGATEPETTAATEVETEPIETTAETTELPTDPTEPAKTSLGEFRLTGYCPCVQCCGDYGADRPRDESGNAIVYTASGAVAQEGVTVAVDPSVIPYGTRLEIADHTYIAQDCGGAVTGNHIDIYFENHEDAWNFGTQTAEVFRLE